MQENAEKIILEVGKVIEGKDEIIKKVLMAILAGGHILLEDVPGVGKTSMALAFSKASGLEYKRIQFTQDTMASDITGYSAVDRDTGALQFRQGSAFCNLLLADEINRTSPKTQAALLEVMEEGRVTVDGETHELPDPFICIATQNPFGSAGTQPLPESQLDRFMIRLSMGYPDTDSQMKIVKARQGANPLNAVEPVFTSYELKLLKGEVDKVHLSDEVIKYAIDLCESTKNEGDLEHGVSPRALLATVAMAKAKATIDGRDFVIPEDIKSVFADVCTHRLVLKPQAKIRNVSASQIIENVLSKVKMPEIK